jgi:hypothetical protein
MERSRAGAVGVSAFDLGIAPFVLSCSYASWQWRAISCCVYYLLRSDAGDDDAARVADTKEGAVTGV